MQNSISGPIYEVRIPEADDSPSNIARNKRFEASLDDEETLRR